MKLDQLWSSEHQAAAMAEGWDLFECYGTPAGSPQVQCFNEPEYVGPLLDGSPVPALKDDTHAWWIVRNGSKPHHVAAREILAHDNPTELAAMMAHQAWPAPDPSGLQDVGVLGDHVSHLLTCSYCPSEDDSAIVKAFLRHPWGCTRFPMMRAQAIAAFPCEWEEVCAEAETR